MSSWLARLRYTWQTNKNLRLSVIAGSLTLGAVFVWIGIYIAITNQPTINDDTPVHKININDKEKKKKKEVVNEASDDVSPRRTNGVLVANSEANREPVGIMIENAAFSGVRPQFGLSEADIIYEVVVEGGITRFLAIYTNPQLPKVIGPVRSARPTYLEFISEYDGLYGHAGGSPDALAAIEGLGIKDLSALGADSRFFYRDDSRTAPHNLFTRNDLVTFALRDKNLSNTEPKYKSWEFKDDNSPEEAPSEEKYVHIDFGSGPLYEVKYVYNYDYNTYDRFNGGEKQTDSNNGNTLQARNVIVQIVPEAIPAGDNGRVNFSVTGEGDVYIARDGEVIKGRWKKPDRLSRTEYFDSEGKAIELNRGTIWVEILPVTGKIEYN